MSDNGVIDKTGLFLKLSVIMGEIGNIPKEGKNTFFNYKFVTADAVADRVRDLLSQHKIAFFAAIVDKELVEIRKVEKNGEIKPIPRWVVTFEFTFADGETGAVMTQRWLAEADSTDDKGINKCATAAQKYFLLKTFVVTSADEPDADASDAPKTPAKRTQPPTNGAQPAQQGSTAANRPNAPISPASTPHGSAPDGSPDEPSHEPTVIIPQVGYIDMKALNKAAYEEKLVKGKSHFANLIRKMVDDGELRDAMNFDMALEAIRKHEAKRDLEREQEKQ